MHGDRNPAARSLQGRRARVVFGAGAALPFVVLAFPGPESDPALTVLAAAAAALVLAGTALTPWTRLSDWWLLVPALGYLGVVALVREAGGGNSSGLGPMVMLPVIGIAMFGSWRTMAVTLAGVAAVYWVPIPLDTERYPVSGYRIGAIFVCVSGLLGVAVQSLRDQLRTQAARFERLAFADELTGLPNRRAWDVAARAALAVAARRRERVCVALNDIHHFTAANDRDGHAAGDALLESIAAAWSAALRAGDVLARVGGDEFAMLVPGCDVSEAQHVLERLRHDIPEPRCSIGVAMWDGEESAEALLDRADALLYEAKRLGRDRIVAESPPSAPALPTQGSG
jgi:diguanylate cyclase (GGDEF)-like protein